VSSADDLQDFLEEWFEDAQEVVTNPSGFFRNETRRDGLEYPIRFALVSFVIAGVLSAGIFGSISGIISTVISGVVGMFIGSAIVHLFASFLGAENGFNETLAVFGYSSIVYPAISLAALIPVVGPIASLAASIFAVFLEVKGLEEFQSMTTGKAALAMLLPAIIGLIIAVVLFVVVLGAGIALMGGL
jgi:hypothetical protein